MKICKHQDCTNKHDSHGYCANHARQYRKYGHPLTKQEVSESMRSNLAKRKVSNLGKTWRIDSAKREAMKGVRKNTGRTHFKGGQMAWNRGLKGYMEGPTNAQWKGDAVGMTALHAWVKRKLGRPKHCVHCGLYSDNPNMIQWANKSHQYKRDLDDWLRLCAKCHKAYDTGKLNLKEIGV